MPFRNVLGLALALTMAAVVPAAPCLAQESPTKQPSATSVVGGPSEVHRVAQEAPRGGAGPAVQDGGAYAQREALSQDLERFYGGNAGLIIVIAVIAAVVIIVAILIPW